eukprot:g31477.t1
MKFLFISVLIGLPLILRLCLWFKIFTQGNHPFFIYPVDELLHEETFLFYKVILMEELMLETALSSTKTDKVIQSLLGKRGDLKGDRLVVPLPLGQKARIKTPAPGLRYNIFEQEYPLLLGQEIQVQVPRTPK